MVVRSRFHRLAQTTGLLLTVSALQVGCGCDKPEEDIVAEGQVVGFAVVEDAFPNDLVQDWTSVDFSDPCECAKLCREALAPEAGVAEFDSCSLTLPDDPTDFRQDATLTCAGVAFPDGKCGEVDDPLGCNL